MKKFIVVLIICLMTTYANAGELTEEKTKTLADKAMSIFQAQNYKEGYNLFLPYWPLPEIEVKTIIYSDLQVCIPQTRPSTDTSKLSQMI